MTSIHIYDETITEALTNLDIRINTGNDGYHALWREFTEAVHDYLEEQLNYGEQYSVEDAVDAIWCDHEYLLMSEDEFQEQKRKAITKYIARLTEYIKVEKIKSFQYIYKATPNYDVWTLIEAQLLTALNQEEATQFGLAAHMDECLAAIDDWEEERGDYDWGCWVFGDHDDTDISTIIGQENLPERFRFSTWICDN